MNGNPSFRSTLEGSKLYVLLLLIIVQVLKFMVTKLVFIINFTIAVGDKPLASVFSLIKVLIQPLNKSFERFSVFYDQTSGTSTIQ